MASTRLRTAEKYISHFATLDKALLESLLADSYRHEFAPISLNAPGPFTKTGFMAHGAGLADIMNGFPVTAKEHFECEASNSVVVWATSEAHFREELMDPGISREEWEYRGEYVFMFTMDEGGEKIVRTVEFLDSASTKERLLGLMARARANLEKVQGKGIDSLKHVE
ncbi:hypothetical protein BJY01DRAFT_160172 [Aspergillus pseudoustus]|uniref:SnoaL-like domain-containing protein n=1 Tax=Aspergillus pseudoustus TaxID=1810923 RepID=A0ABR4K801_9EURO